ncbi:PoNe immunity protein domain-containing protein [Massilia sp. SR12]
MDFIESRRQPFLNEESYQNMLEWLKDDVEVLREKLAEPTDDPRDNVAVLKAWAYRYWNTFLLRLTGGDDVSSLAPYLTQVVEAFEDVALALNDVPEAHYYPPFVLNDMIDTYVDYLNLLSAAVLLHREDLIPRIFSLIEETDYDGSDAVIETLLSFYLPDRPTMDFHFWKPYTPLFNAINQQDPVERAKGMERFVKNWYQSMKGVAHFWGKHEQIEPDFTPYFGYWAMCSAAFTYLYDLDDTGYRDEMVYPKDMVDFARSMPRQPVTLEDGREILRVLGGQACPAAGTWLSPAKPDSACHFKKGETMPVFDSGYGLTIWQLEAQTTTR